jgi:putative ABC transport system permease protein
VLVVVLSLVAVAIGSRRVAAVSAAPIESAPRAPSLPPFLARLGAGPTAVVGARMAVDRGHGARSVPVRSGFIAIAVGAAALVGSLTFAADLDQLINTPRLVGWNWDTGFIGGIEPTNAAPDADPASRADEAVRRALEVEGVARAGYVTLFPPNDAPLIKSIPDVWPVSFSTGPGSIKPTVMSGRAPAGPDEILVTPTVLHELDLEIGDPLEVQGVTQTEAGDTVLSPSVVTIVGTGVAPIGDGLFEHTVVLTFDGLRELAPSAEPHLAVVDFTPGADRARATKELTAVGMLGPIDTDKINVTALVDLDVRTADTVPRLLGALMAVLSIGVLMHLVYAGVRAGRRDLATMRVLGFSRRQVIGAVAWQTSIVVGVPFAAGAIIGSITGRAVWLIYADRLGVAPDAVVAWGAIIGVSVAFMLAATAIGVVIGRRAHARSPAELLRAE